MLSANLEDPSINSLKNLFCTNSCCLSLDLLNNSYMREKILNYPKNCKNDVEVCLYFFNIQNYRNYFEIFSANLEDPTINSLKNIFLHK